ncbi:MAG: transposase [Colwellia sp.]|nr:transposase [Colwellia sp.]
MEAQDAQPKGKKVKADTALGYINTLYRIERKLTELKETQEYTRAQVVEYRRKHSTPVLIKLKVFLDKSLNRVSSESLTGIYLFKVDNGRTYFDKIALLSKGNCTLNVLI